MTNPHKSRRQLIATQILAGPAACYLTSIVTALEMEWRLRASERRCPKCEGQGGLGNDWGDTLVCDRCDGTGSVYEARGGA